MAKQYRASNGKIVNMQELILKNEKIRAVGNMNVNARGDIIDNENKTISKRNSQVNKNYRKQIGKVAKSHPIMTSTKEVKKPEVKEAPAVTMENLFVEEIKEEKQPKKPKKGN